MSLRVTWFKTAYTPQKLGDMLLAEIDHAHNYLTKTDTYTANEGLARDLIAAGADLTRRNARGDTAFLAAVGQRRLGVMQAILDSGHSQVISDRNTGSWSYTALHLLVETNDSKTLQQLLSLGLAPEAIDSRHNQNGFFWAARLGRPQIMALFLSDCPKMDINAKDCYGTTLLMTAISQTSPHTALHLLARKDIDIDATDMNGLTARDWAEQTGMKIIIQRIADIDAERAAVAAARAEQKKVANEYYKKGLPLTKEVAPRKIHIRQKRK